MTSQNFTINAQTREPASKGAIKKMRQTGLVPGIIYGRQGNTAISIPVKALPREHTRAALLNIAVGGATRMVIMREVQINPLNDQPIHIDFQEVQAGESVAVKVPLEFVGLTREQEKEGSFKTLLRSLEVVAPADKLPASLKVNVGHLKVDESAHIKDVEIPQGVALRSRTNLALASLVKL